VRIVVCDEVCVWVVDGFPDDEGSLRALLEAPNCIAVVMVVKVAVAGVVKVVAVVVVVVVV
jgi:hypothetical protein